MQEPIEHKVFQTHDAALLFPEMSTDEYQALKADIAQFGQRDPIVLHDDHILDGRHRYRACCELGIKPSFVTWNGSDSPVIFVISQNLHRRHLTASQRAAVAVQAEAMRQAEKKAKSRQLAGGARGRESRSHKVSIEDEKNLLVEILPQANLAPKEQAARKQEPNRSEASISSSVFPKDAPGSRKSRDEVAGSFGTNSRYVQDAKTIREADPDLLEQVKRGERTIPQVKQELRRRQKREALQSKSAEVQPTHVDWEIRFGRCEEVLMSVEHKARLIFADPPYNIGINYGDGEAADRLDDQDYLAWVEQWLVACRDQLTDDGSIWILISDEYAAEFVIILKRLGLKPRSWIKWFESFGVNCSNRFNRCSRHLLYFVRNAKNFVFNEDPVSRASDRQTKYGDKRAASGGKLWDDVWGIEPPIPRLTGTCQERIPDFPTQLPLALLTPIVLCASEPGDLVIDPFNGSGTTGFAAIQSGRRYIGIEKSEAFAEVATLRLKGVVRE